VIRSVHIQNFRCLRDVRLELGPLTVLVGPNASGKSAILRALAPDVGWNPNDLNDHWQHDPESRIVIKCELMDNRSATVAGPNTERYPYQHLRLQLDIQKLRKPNLLAREDRLAQDGSNLANLLKTLTRQQEAALSKEFCQLVPAFADLDTVPLADGQHVLRFQDRWNPSVWYGPGEVSDGTMLVAAFLTLQYQPAPIDFVAIEEPERGLHPYLVGEVITLLRNLATGAIGPRPIQVVLATQSAELLEHVQPEEVRFLDRRPEDGSVQVTRIDTTSPDWQATFKEYVGSLGSAWLSGGLGGVPGAQAAE
jgi:predicted ATPase